MVNLISFLIIAVLFEGALFLLVNLLKKNFAWIITQKDELPEFEPQALQKFIDYSFDPLLGWVRKPNTSGKENGKNGLIEFSIDSIGSRVTTFNTKPAVVAAFGDSYTFCRQVENDETWEAQLSKRQGFGVLNFGVGNYGVDQALLRYENTDLPDSVKFIVLGFVPETICRIQSRWKHYLEFGNTFAFKPRFILDSMDQLKLIENPMQTYEDFQNLKAKLPEIRKTDRFYNEKFRRFQFRTPYSLNFIRNPIKYSMLFYTIIIRELCKLFRCTSNWVTNAPFMLVMKSNIKDAHKLYFDSESTELLSGILQRFKNEAVSRGHIPVVLVMPQLLDLKLGEKNKPPYQNYFDNLSEQLLVIDFTNEFKSLNPEKLYINDQYGGHLSEEGNKLVAESLSRLLDSNNELKE